MSSTASFIVPLLQRLERWLAVHRPRYVKGLRPGLPAPAADLPKELQILLQWHDGEGEGIHGALENNWHLMCSDGIVAARLDLLSDPESGWDTPWFPFLDDDAGNFVFLDTSRDNQPVCEYWQGKKEKPSVATSLRVWLERFLSAVERGEYVEDPERGTFLRRTT